MQQQSIHFRKNAHKALENPFLRQAMKNAQHKFTHHRSSAIALYDETLGNFEEQRQLGEWVRNQTLIHWADYLETFEKNAQKNGSTVHWALDEEEACSIVEKIAFSNNVKSIIKSKSMISEEINLNQALEQKGFEVTETDLGEYILQLAKEPPSHIVAPAVHKNVDDVRKLFKEHHRGSEPANSIEDLTRQARSVLREKFINADMGITGANFLVAETGSVGIVTNEGNGCLTSILPKIRVVLVGIEKVLGTLQDAADIIELLPRSATGQAISNYLTLTSRSLKSEEEHPEQLHFVLIDSGRSSLLGSNYEDMLRCIRCGACMNHCPVYQHVGGHAYGWVYPGPMGAILTSLYTDMKQSIDLPHAATLCGQCHVVCPVKIPLPKLLHQLRLDQVEQNMRPNLEKVTVKICSFLAMHPMLYRMSIRLSRLFLCFISSGNVIKKIPVIQFGWFSNRFLPKPRN